jgi:poly(A)-specific ribonuclease
VFEALVGGGFADEIDVTLLLGPGPHTPNAIASMKERLQRLEKATKSRERVVVAHNSLFDLCFMYQTFVGDLPQSLRQFKIDLQTLFPRLVDTKYMATREVHELDPDMSLEQLYDTVKKYHLPQVSPTLPPRKVAHQAGYDSESQPEFRIPSSQTLTSAGWVTAMTFLKLSWKLGRDCQLLKT